MPRKIDVLLIDGQYDHYIVPIAMGTRKVAIGNEAYVRTDEVRKVEVKGVGTETYRVYTKESDA